MKFEDLKFTEYQSKTNRKTGIQARHKFENGYGVSVIQLFYLDTDGNKIPVSYGAENDLYELAVTKNGSIQGDVYGYLDKNGVEELLVKIQAL